MISYLEAQVIDTSSSKNDIDASIQNLLDAFLGDVRFALTNGVQLSGIRHQNLNTTYKLH